MRSTVFGNRPRLDSVELLEIPAPTSVFTSIVESGRRWAPLVTAFSKVSAADLAERLDELTQLRQAHALCDFAVTSQPDSERPLRQFGFTEVRVLGRDDLLAPSCPHGLRVAVVGPCLGSYSLAVVNRELAAAINAIPGLECGLVPHDIGAEAVPSRTFLWGNPSVRALIAHGTQEGKPDVAIGNAWPPPLQALHAPSRWLLLFWEESRLPSGLLEEFSRELDGMLAPSSFVANSLGDCGFEGPVPVVGTGVCVPRSALRAPYRRARRASKTFTFLHVSSGLPRKGVDVLLRAYARAFSSSDHVRLTLRVGPYLDVAVETERFRRMRPDSPDLDVISRELPAPAYYSLFETADCFVSATRGEGFGIPAAEAMLYGLPVIITGYGGQTDFCTEETALLVRYELQPARTHFAIPGSEWAEPDEGHLATLMRQVFENPDAEPLELMKLAAARLISSEYSWSRVADKVVAALARSR